MFRWFADLPIERKLRVVITVPAMAAFAIAMTCAREACADSNALEKSVSPSGCFALPATVPPCAAIMRDASACSVRPKL